MIFSIALRTDGTDALEVAKRTNDASAVADRCRKSVFVSP